MSEAGLLADPVEVRAILVASARAGEPISYSEVLELLGHLYPFNAVGGVLYRDAMHRMSDALDALQRG